MSEDLSRRTLLRTGAAAGAAGLAVGALGVAATTAFTDTAAAPATKAGPATNSASGPVVLHVRDAKTGEIEIFTGSDVLRLRDTAITSRIAAAIG